jgi:hypothetical protein
MYNIEYKSDTFPLLLKGAERIKIARWAILAKEPACRAGFIIPIPAGVVDCEDFHGLVFR